MIPLTEYEAFRETVEDEKRQSAIRAVAVRNAGRRVNQDFECPQSSPGLHMERCFAAMAAAPLRPKWTWDSLKRVTREP